MKQHRLNFLHEQGYLADNLEMSTYTMQTSFQAGLRAHDTRTHKKTIMVNMA